MKRNDWISIIAAVVVVVCFIAVHSIVTREDDSDRVVKIGFVYEGDESVPYSSNFIRAQRAMESVYGDRVEVTAVYNQPYAGAEKVIRGLAESGCEIIFVNSVGYEEATKRVAGEFPEVQFCQAAGSTANEEPVHENFHTFMGEIYQGRFVSGVVAGLKLRELIDNREIAAEEAKLGYVGAIPCAEVISGYTAFLLGVRSVVPQATMVVRYTNTWSSYELEKKAAEALLAEGCVILSQHSDTIGPAVVCEKASATRPVYIVGYNQSMMDVAPTSALVSCRINWSPYILSAVEAMFAKDDIERHVKGHIHGNDAGAGFSRDWVQMLELNDYVCAPDTRAIMEETIADLKAGRIQVFKGDYTGVNFQDPTDVIDLSGGYTENRDSSAPAFCYILTDMVTIRED